MTLRWLLEDLPIFKMRLVETSASGPSILPSTYYAGASSVGCFFFLLRHRRKKKPAANTAAIIPPIVDQGNAGATVSSAGTPVIVPRLAFTSVVPAATPVASPVSSMVAIDSSLVQIT